MIPIHGSLISPRMLAVNGKKASELTVANDLGLGQWILLVPLVAMARQGALQVFN
jgi:hypothetical protein